MKRSKRGGGHCSTGHGITPVNSTEREQSPQQMLVPSPLTSFLLLGSLCVKKSDYKSEITHVPLVLGVLGESKWVLLLIIFQLEERLSQHKHTTSQESWEGTSRNITGQNLAVAPSNESGPPRAGVGGSTSVPSSTTM